MRRKIPSTLALVAFSTAARHQSFTKAANELSLSQSAVCRQISGLEDFLRVKLFRRTRQGVRLTEAGMSYSRQIATRLDAVERDTLAVMAHQGRGLTIDLAVVPTFATKWLLPRLGGFLAGHAGVQVNFETRTRPFLFDDTEFDAAIYFGDAGWPGTQASFLMWEQSLPVCSPRLLAAGAIEPGAIAHILADDSEVEAIKSEISLAQEMGVSSVPFFIFDGVYGISGAQPPETFVEVFKAIEQENARAEADGLPAATRDAV